MKTRLAGAFLSVGFLFTTLVVLAQPPAQEARPYEPTVGQEGKDVVWVPTPDALVQTMLDMAGVTARDVVYDLGSGDGRTVIAAAKRGARAYGIEYNPEMVELSRQRAAEAGLADRATFEKADLFETDLSRATVITMFLLPDINLKLRPKLLDLAPGTRVVSNSFRMAEWEPDEEKTIEDEECTSWCTALLWIVPAKVEGTWKLPQGALAVTQEFQKIEGTLDGTPISEGRVRGTEITFIVGRAKYSGRVNGNRIEGTISGGAGGRFRAERAD